MQRSPFTPGVVTTSVVGRDQQISAAQRELLFMKVDPQFGGRIHVNVGMRGVGKTSLLRTIEELAKDNSFSTVFVTAGDQPLLDSLSAALLKLTSGWAEKARSSLARILSRLSLSFGPVEISPDTAPETTLTNNARTLQEALEFSAKEVGTPGLVLFIDEIQESDSEGLKSLAYAWQHMQTESTATPIMMFTAGLSHTQDVITDAVSFAERFNYTHLDRLSEAGAREALVTPANSVGVDWSDAALDSALEAAAGYPYFLQLIGDYTWQEAGFPAPGQILTDEHVDRARNSFHIAQSSFFRARWLKASQKEKDVLGAIAELGGEASRHEIAQRLKVTSDSLGMVRRSLLDKGLIEAPMHGKLSLSVPGFTEFIVDENQKN